MTIIPISENSCILAKDTTNSRHINIKANINERDSMEFLNNELAKWLNEVYENGKIEFCCDDEFNWNLFKKILSFNNVINTEMYHSSPMYLSTFLYILGFDTNIDRGGDLIAELTPAEFNNYFIDHITKHIANYDKDMHIVRDALWMSIRLAYIFGKIEIIKIKDGSVGTVIFNNPL